MSRLRSSRDSDSHVKSGCSHLILDGLTLYLDFLVGVRGRAPMDKNRKTRSSKLLEKHRFIFVICFLLNLLQSH